MAYCNNNPLLYLDPSGMFFEEIWGGVKSAGKAIGDAAVWAWDVGSNAAVGAVDGVLESFFPTYHSSFPVSNSSYYWGKGTGNLTSSVIGGVGTLLGFGGTAAGGALALASGGTLAPGSALVMAGSAALTGVSAGVFAGGLSRFEHTVDQARNFSSQGSGGGRGKNNLKPDPNAEGAHSTFSRDASGRINKYTTWEPNPRNPSGFDEVIRFDGTGKEHFNKVTGKDVFTPHMRGRSIPGDVRTPYSGEFPRGW